MKLLIIEDDRHLSDTVKETTKEMFETDQAFDGEEGLFFAERNIYDCIILDLMMPSMNGYDVLQQMRKKSISTPVVILTAKDGINDKLQGLRAGADDYLIKPFHREELLLRLGAILRRSGREITNDFLTFKQLKMNVKNKTTTIENEPIKLNGKLFDLMEYFLNNKNVILTKEQIFDRIWGFESDTSTSVVEVYASNLRKILKAYQYDHYIQTFRGFGYMLSENSDAHE